VRPFQARPRLAFPIDRSPGEFIAPLRFARPLPRLAVVGGVPKNNAAAEQDFLNGFDEVNFHPEKKSARDFVGEVSDGPEAVRKVEELRPESILSDIGVPGLEAARQICKLAPKPKNVFLGLGSSDDVERGPSSTETLGNLVNSKAASELPLR
jgi:hypothetical protein